MKLLVSSCYKSSKTNGFSFAEHQLLYNWGVRRIKSLVRNIFEYYKQGKIEKSAAVELLKLLKNEGFSKVNDIAVIGIALKFPGADNCKEFWTNLKNKVDSIRSFPENRKRDARCFIENYLGIGMTDAQFPEGGYLNEIDKFDCNFFKISPKEANLMDPNQRLFLQTAYEAIEDAGYGNDKLKGSNTGVFVGCGSFPVYGQFISKVMPDHYYASFAGNVTPIISSRIGYFFDFHGPSMLVDTACSSSLVAVHLACRAIKDGDCDQAIAGGISINLMPVKRPGHIGIESEDYRTRTFDYSSTGTAFGEGVAAILLKPLEKALMDRDNIYGVIKGSAINQDGNSIGITAPNVLAQTDVILKAWSDARINPDTISYLECHGTGTKLGDPIEIEGIKAAFKRHTDKKQICAVGSVKTNIGHLDNAAGLAGMIKALLALKNKEIPPSLHYGRPNREIDFQDSPLYVCDKLRVWNSGSSPRRCGVSSFGISGTNCHIVLEEVQANKKGHASYNKTINVLCISAGNEKQLRQLIYEYYRVLIDLPEEDISNMCYTINTGRGHYRHRVVLIVRNKNDLLQKIHSFQYKSFMKNDSDEYFYGEHVLVPENKEKLQAFESTPSMIEVLSGKAEEIKSQFLDSNKESDSLLRELCKLYVRGAVVDWEALYTEESLSKISLPVYLFKRSRCWLDENEFQFTNNYFREQLESLNEKTYNKENEDSSKEKDDRSNEKLVISGREDKEYTKEEVIIANAWADVFGIKEIDIYDGYYNLGGDSILAVKIINRVNKVGGYDLEVKDIFGHLNIASLAEYIKNKTLENVIENDVRIIKKASQKGYYELSSAQKRIFVLHSLNLDSLSYNLPSAMVITGKLDINRLENNLKELTRRHESLRTSFCMIDGEPKQKIHEAFKFEISVQEAEEDNLQQAIKEFIKPFDIQEPPLMRAHLLIIGEDKQVLVLDFHHIIFDGYSMDVFTDEIIALYQGNKFEELTLQYKDYAQWQTRLSETPYLKKQEEFWLDVYSKPLRPLDLPVDFQRNSSVQHLEGDVFEFEIDDVLTKKVRLLISERSSTLYIFLLAIYNILLSKFCNQEDIVVGTPVSGRTNIDTEKMIGMFVNMLSMRNAPQADKRFIDFLDDVKQNAIKAFNNQDFQFDTLVKLLNLNSNLNRNPLFDTTFVLQNIGSGEIELEGLKFSRYSIESRETPFELVWEAFESDTKIYFTLRYASNLYKRETIKRLCENYISIIEQVVENCYMKLIDVSVEGEQVLIEKDVDLSVISTIDFDF